jgi:membrane complex biogenesis BtpA family protein
MMRRPVLGIDGPVVGVLHLPPLPGSPRHEGGLETVLRPVLADASVLADAGMDALLVENFGDAPFLPGRVGPETVAAMTTVTREVKRAHPTVPLGVNVLRSDGPAAMAVAHAAGAAFIRVNVHGGVVVTDQGIVEGLAHETLRMRDALGAGVQIWADVGVKHAAPLFPRPLAMEARDLERRALADVLMVTGPATGAPCDIEEAEEVREAVDVPVLVASGVTAETVGGVLGRCDGVVVGSALRKHGRAGAPVQAERVRALLAGAGR